MLIIINKMVIENKTAKSVMVVLLKDFSLTHSVSSLAEKLGLSRVGMWKILKKLEIEKFIILDSVGTGRTSTYRVKLNWENVLVERALAFFLMEESVKYSRWIFNFRELEEKVDFLVLYGSILTSPSEANDIDILNILSKKENFGGINKILNKIQVFFPAMRLVKNMMLFID